MGRPVTKAKNTIVVSQYDQTKFDLACQLVPNTDNNFDSLSGIRSTRADIMYPHISVNSSVLCEYRVIHLSSGLGNLAKLSKLLQDRSMSPDLNVEGLSELMDQFLR